MRRDIGKLADSHFDVLVVGGGIYGAFIAWDAALRGLKVALIEKSDFGSATSSNSLKIIHGGLRYLQHADFKRMRESIMERRNLMHIAPHLVHPLPCIMPTYGHALQGKEVMAVALLINDLVGFDRNKNLDPQKHLPKGKVISKEECKKMIPGVDEENLTGGALWYDCQLYNSERMLLSVLHSASECEAVLANYVEMVDFKIDKEKIVGALAKDKLTDEEFEISASLVINSSGPWVKQVLQRLRGKVSLPKIKLTAAMNLVIRKKIFPKYAVGVWSKVDFEDKDSVLKKGGRLLFITPWKNYSIIGTTHVHYEGGPSQFKITEKDIETFLKEINTAYPPAQLTREDVSFSYGGMLPAYDEPSVNGDVNLLKNYKIIDHQKSDGLDGLISIIGVKYTTARDVAEKAVDIAMQKLKVRSTPSATSVTQIFGGKFDNFTEFITQQKSKAPSRLSENIIEHLVHNYGSEYSRVLKYGEENKRWLEPIASETEVLKAEIIHAIREEMAVTLADVLRRRTELGSACVPSDNVVNNCAQLMSQELNWDKRTKEEVVNTKDLYAVAY